MQKGNTEEPSLLNLQSPNPRGHGSKADTQQAKMRGRLIKDDPFRVLLAVGYRCVVLPTASYDLSSYGLTGISKPYSLDRYTTLYHEPQRKLHESPTEAKIHPHPYLGALCTLTRTL